MGALIGRRTCEGPAIILARTGNHLLLRRRYEERAAENLATGNIPDPTKRHSVGFNRLVKPPRCCHDGSVCHLTSPPRAWLGQPPGTVVLEIQEQKTGGASLLAPIALTIGNDSAKSPLAHS